MHVDVILSHEVALLQLNDADLVNPGKLVPAQNRLSNYGRFTVVLIGDETLLVGESE